jgi:hypothetical protein
VVFVPLAGEFATTEMIWLADNPSPALRRVTDVVTELAATMDLTTTG